MKVLMPFQTQSTIVHDKFVQWIPAKSIYAKHCFEDSVVIVERALLACMCAMWSMFCVAGIMFIAPSHTWKEAQVQKLTYRIADKCNLS